MGKQLDRFRMWNHENNDVGLIEIGVPVCVWIPIYFFFVTQVDLLPAIIRFILIVLLSPLILSPILIVLLCISDSKYDELLNKNNNKLKENL